MSARVGHLAVLKLLCGKEAVDLDVKDNVRIIAFDFPFANTKRR